MKSYSKKFISIDSQTLFLTPGSPKDFEAYRVIRNGIELTANEHYYVDSGKVNFIITLVKGDNIIVHWIK